MALSASISPGSIGRTFGEFPSLKAWMERRSFIQTMSKKPIEKKYMERVECAAKGQPIPAGAVVLFGASAANKCGHIGICINTEGEKINLLEQDGFKQDGAKIAQWSYDRVLGWLVKREAA